MEPPSPPEAPTAPTTGAPARGRSARIDPALVILVLAALALRLWAVGWALPTERRLFTYHPDEGVNLVGGVLIEGVFRPHLDLAGGGTSFYNYGTLYFYLWQAAVAANRAYGFVSLGAGSLHPASPESLPSMLLMGRLVTVVLGVLTVWAVYSLGRRLGGRVGGAVAGAAWALAPAAVVHGAFATVDVPTTFLVAVALALSARLAQDPRGVTAILAGLCCGLAAATKYNAGLVLAAPLAGAWAAGRGCNDEAHAPRRATLAALAAAAAAVGFLIACPAPLINPEAFLRDFRREALLSAQGAGLVSAGTAPGWWHHLAISLPVALGWPLLLLSLGGIGLLAARRRPADLAVLAFAAAYYTLISMSERKYLRYVIPLIPVLAAGAGVAAQAAWEGRSTAWRQAARGGILAALALTAGLAAGWAGLMALPDPRDRAIAWLEAHAPPRAVLALASVPWHHSPPLAPETTAPSPALRYQAARQSARFAVRVPPPNHDLDPVVLAPPRPHYVVVSSLLTDDWERLRLPAWREFRGILEREYKPVVFENPLRLFGIRLPRPRRGPHDMLYVWPRITIYERRGPRTGAGGED